MNRIGGTDRKVYQVAWWQEPTGRRERTLLLIAAAFMVVGAITLLICDAASPVCDVSPDAPLLVGSVLAWGLSFGALHVSLSRCLPERDPLLLPVAALLSGWGLLLVGRSVPALLSRQATWMLVSTVVLLAVLARPDLRWLRRYRYTWLLIGLVLLLMTIFMGVNPSGFGPRLWLGLGGAYFQPSEPLKLLLVVYMASYLAERRDLLVATGRRVGPLRLPTLAYAGPLLAMFGITVLLLAWQQDLGAAMLFFFTFLAMLYLATGRWEYVAVGLASFVVAGSVIVAGSTRLALRVQGWLNPWPYSADHAFQIVQSLIALGAGGVSGQGFGLGRPRYIPAIHTDFCFAAIAEEFGLAGALATIALYAILLVRGLRAAVRAPRPFERLLAAGLTAGLVIQAWVIIAANIRVAPIAGVTLPFLSYGGSSLLSTFIALGLLLHVSAPAVGRREPPTSRPAGSAVDRTVLRIACTLGVGLALLAATCGYWGVARSDWLVAREDNPRRVEYERRVIRGRLLDRGGTVLADVEVSDARLVSRTYPVPEAAPVVGYASLRYGVGGVESAFDAYLRGEAGRTAWEAAWDGWLHRPPAGWDVQLTLDAELQRAAQAALERHAGAAVLIDADTGAVLAMASAPTFDPALLDEMWDTLREDPRAPLVNRAAQGLYQPGAALETVVLAAALNEDLVSMGSPAPALTATIALNGAELSCLQALPSTANWVGAYQAACPGPFAVLGEELGTARLTAAVAAWGLDEAPAMALPVGVGVWAPDDIALEAIGQGQFTVSPLRMALVAATLANDGVMPAPYVAVRAIDPQGVRHALTARGVPRTPISPDLAWRLLLAWTQYGDAVRGHLGVAVAGESRPPHAWFLGVAPGGAPRYAVAVVLEHAPRPDVAAEVGRALLELALTR